MTKAEFLTALEATPPIVQIDVPKFIQDISIIDKSYMVNCRKIVGNKVNYENISFAVVNEGTPQEAAYFLQRNVITFANNQESGPVTETP